VIRKLLVVGLLGPHAKQPTERITAKQQTTLAGCDSDRRPAAVRIIARRCTSVGHDMLIFTCLLSSVDKKLA
jgi:hypothetical protein